MDARLTMVEGKILYRDGAYTDDSIEELEAAAVAAARAARLPSDPANRDRTRRYRSHICDHYRKLTAGALDPEVKA